MADPTSASPAEEAGGGSVFRRAPSGSTSVVRRLISFAQEFESCVGPQKMIVAALAVLLAGITEGIGLALLAPLLELLGEPAGSLGWISRAVARWFGWFGLPLSLSVLLLAFVGLVVARSLLVAVRDLALARLRLDFTNALRERAYQAIAGASWQFLMRQRLSDILETLTSHIDGVAFGTYFFLDLPATGVIAAIQIGVALSISPSLTIFVLCWSGVLLFLFHLRFGNRYEEGERSMVAHRAAFAEMSDFLHALKLAKSHNAESRHVAAFKAAIKRQSAETIAFERGTTRMRLAIQVGAAVTLGIFVYVAATLAHVASAGLLLMVVIFSRLAPLIAQFQQGWLRIVHMLPVFDRVIRLEALSIGAAEPADTGAPRTEVRRDIRFCGVGFHYDRERDGRALDGIDLAIPAGSTLAIIGATGAGKSTLADLLLGLLAPDTGTILIDGVPLAGPILASWRRSVGYVPQDNFLFNDTVRANLLWACPEATDQDLHWALTVAAAGFVDALPKGLDTEIGERGVRLSGGERQRLGLARAVLSRPTLLLLDEATSALDTQTERAVQVAVEELRGSMTIVMIAHRLSTVRHADQIVVLDKGKLVQSGAWEALAGDRQGGFASLLGESDGAP